MELGVEMVTVYAFSLENFKRSDEEVKALMTLAGHKFQTLLERGDLVERHGICIRVLGRINMLPIDLQRSIARAVHMSRGNSRAVLNVCFAYTARDEVVQAATAAADAVQRGVLRAKDVDEGMLSRCLYTDDAREPDLLVRTSGEVRLSDFLLWQSSYTYLAFTPVLWPELTTWDLFKCFLAFQQHQPALAAARQHARAAFEKARHAQDLEEARRQKWQKEQQQEQEQGQVGQTLEEEEKQEEEKEEEEGKESIEEEGKESIEEEEDEEMVVIETAAAALCRARKARVDVFVESLRRERREALELLYEQYCT